MKLNELLSEWMTVHREEEIKPQTIIRYECCINNYIKDSLGQEDIRSITIKTIQSYVEGLKQTLGERTEKELSTSSVRCVLAVLKLAFDYAVENDLIPSNPAKRVFAPFGKEKKGAEAFTLDEQKAIESYVLSEGVDGNYGILLSLYTGIRIGELVALTWDDVNLEYGSISVTKTQTVNKDDSGHWKPEDGAPRSEASGRIIPLPQFVVEDLQAIKERSKSSYVFTLPSGNPMNAKILRWRFEQILIKLEIRKLSFNSLRHSFATRAIDSGMYVVTLSEILGHAEAGNIINIYKESFKFNKEAMTSLKRIGNK